jgi:hypothetical protein
VSFVVLLREDSWNLAPGSLQAAHVPFPFANLTLCFFTLTNPSHEDDLHVESWEFSKQITESRVSWELPTHLPCSCK